MTLSGSLRVLGALLALFLAAVGLMWAFQRKLIYLPLDRDIPRVGQVLPGAEEATLATEDGLELGAWFLPSKSPKAATVLFFNGNAGNRSDRAPLARALHRRGFSVLLMDYRGYGGNPGTPGEAGLGADARAAVSFLEQRAEVDSDSIVYFGESLGAAVALGLAIERPPAALILRSPFTSLVDTARLHYPFLPVRWLLRDRYPSMQRILSLECPVLIMAGSEDRIVPERHSRALFEQAPEGRKSYLQFEGAGHNDRDFMDGARMIGAVSHFIEQWTGDAPLHPETR